MHVTLEGALLAWYEYENMESLSLSLSLDALIEHSQTRKCS